ncbi:HAD family hydrolase [Fulvimonas soli]|uniref:HAD superfamily hydrolase (TIGR01509 family) n=1 Tax=Fulvimonas soli TaxID=155197 RepID=A0A316I5H2_9GAMM|nr:HAD family hydrolase [Fulvimonas soli]PWK88526.1 HAD superfamily hydrolase (TIGR01509 family) [Fulvimonas soli]TNY27470.1 HAD family hydrolase [Fulvimonas soli]
MADAGVPAPFALVIFDCDGVLVDSETIINRVFARMLGEHGLALTPQETAELFTGKANAECLALAGAMLGRPLPAGFAADYDERARAALAAEVRAMPGIAEALDALDVPCAVASNGGHAKMRVTLGRAGLLHRFEGRLFGVEDVPRPKPAPDLYLHAARTLGVPPAACAVVEDSPTGVAAGVAAGMTVFGFAAHTPRARLREAGAHAVFDAMAGLPALLRAAPARPG